MGSNRSGERARDVGDGREGIKDKDREKGRKDAGLGGDIEGEGFSGFLRFE